MTRRLTIWIILLLLFVGLIVASAISGAGGDIDTALPISKQGVTYSARTIQKGTSDGGNVAIVRVTGAIVNGDSPPGGGATGSEDVIRQLEGIGERDEFDAVILEINSPGGGVLASAEIAEQVERVQDEYDLKVVSWMRDAAASGGYYISAPADGIIAAPSTFTGSIGVILQYVTVGELTDKIGVEPVTIKSGKLKDIGSPYRDATPEEVAILQGIIDEAYNDFVDIVASGRDLSESKTREIADGRIYTGTQAKKLGLVDELGTRRETYDFTAELIDTDDGESLTVVEFNREYGFFDSLAGADGSLDPLASLSLGSLTETITGVPAPANGFVSLEYRAVP